MLRSLGSSLVAKSQPGSAYRKMEEMNIEKPDIPNKGQVGSVQRTQVEEPLQRPVPEGTEKIVAVQPTVEGTTAADQIAPVKPTAPITPAMGTEVTPKVPAGANNQPLFQGGITSPTVAASKATMGKTGSTTSLSGGVATPTVKGASTSVIKPVQAQAPVEARESFGRATGLSGLVGSKAYADTTKNLRSAVQQVQQWTPTAGQYISGAVGKAINAVGQALGNRLPEKGVSENLQSFGGARSVQKAGTGSISGAVGNIANQLRSKANQVFSGLRSLFGGK